MSQINQSARRAFTAGLAIAIYLRVIVTAGKLAIAGSTDHEIGTIDEEAFADGDVRPVNLRTAQGTSKFVASEAITAGNPFYAASGGKVAASGTVLIGIALEGASGNNSVFEGIRRQETSDSAASGGTTAAAFLVDSDATIPKIELASYVGGTGDYKVTLKPAATLTGNVVATLPDATGTVVLADAAQTITGKKKVVEAHTAGDTLTVAESGSVHTSVGASGTVALVLPAAVVGLEYFFRVGAAQELRIDPDGTETIALPSTGVQGGAGKYLTANADGETVHLVCTKAGEWSVFGFTGTWTAEP